jgi:hypothetical protein
MCVCLAVYLPTVARQWLGKNPLIVARQRLGRNVTAVVGRVVFNVVRVVSRKVGD